MATRRKQTDYLTTNQAAAWAGVTPGRIRQIDFPGCVRIGTQRLIPVAEVEKFASKPAKSGRPRGKKAANSCGKPAFSGIVGK